MNKTQLSPTTLDTILACQLTIAWAGEALTEPPRLKWWRTAMVDDTAGGDLLQRLAPRTYQWASLEVVREAAALTDRKARQRMADPDRVRTLFFWGFEVDELVGERLHQLKWGQKEPARALTFPLPLTEDFQPARLEEALKAAGETAAYTVQTSGRELKATLPEDLGTAARMLLGAMLPLASEYPAPFFRV